MPLSFLQIFAFFFTIQFYFNCLFIFLLAPYSQVDALFGLKKKKAKILSYYQLLCTWTLRRPQGCGRLVHIRWYFTVFCNWKTSSLGWDICLWFELCIFNQVLKHLHCLSFFQMKLRAWRGCWGCLVHIPLAVHMGTHRPSDSYSKHLWLCLWAFSDWWRRSRNKLVPPSFNPIKDDGNWNKMVKHSLLRCVQCCLPEVLNRIAPPLPAAAAAVT